MLLFQLQGTTPSPPLTKGNKPVSNTPVGKAPSRFDGIPLPTVESIKNGTCSEFQDAQFRFQNDPNLVEPVKSQLEIAISRKSAALFLSGQLKPDGTCKLDDKTNIGRTKTDNIEGPPRTGGGFWDSVINMARRTFGAELQKASGEKK